MKRWIGFGLAVMLLLSGCGKESSMTTKRNPVDFSDGNPVAGSSLGGSSSDSSGAASGSQGEAVLQAEDVETLVTDGFSKQVHYKDQIGNDYECSFEVPQINLNSPDARECNEELEALAADVISQAQEAAKNHDILLDQGISYDTWVQGQMLVLLVTVENSWDSNRYYAYVFDGNTGARLDHAGVAEKVGRGADELEDQLAYAVEQEYRQTYEGMEDMDARLYQMQLDRCLEVENLRQAQIYPDRDGNLMVTATIYSLAGADSYIHNFPLV